MVAQCPSDDTYIDTRLGLVVIAVPFAHVCPRVLGQCYWQHCADFSRDITELGAGNVNPIHVLMPVSDSELAPSLRAAESQSFLQRPV